jgi:antitoxin Phd
MHVSATVFKNNFGQYMEASIREPVIVEKSGRPASVLLSYHDFQKFLELEDRIWGLRALEAHKKGYLGPEKSAALLKKLEERLHDTKT